jgi:hypothetical protein
MEPNLNNTFEYDKHVINIDSTQGINNNGNDFGYYIKFDEVFKNVVALQIMNVAVVIPSISSTPITNPATTTTTIETVDNGDNTKTRTTTTVSIVINNNADGSVVETNTTTTKTEDLDADDFVVNESTIINTTTNIANGNFVKNQDKFYITLNEIDRGISYINDGNNKFNIVKYLEVIEYTGIKSESNIGTSTCSFLESSTHMFNPVIQRLDRFDVSIKDTNFESIPKSNIASVNIKLCLYTIKKNIT